MKLADFFKAIFRVNTLQFKLKKRRKTIAENVVVK
jgi:hypothetical protein